MHESMIAQCAAPALALAVGGALRAPYPLIPPALNRCDEAAEVKNMLYSSYGQKGCTGYMDNLKGCPHTQCAHPICPQQPYAI